MRVRGKSILGALVLLAASAGPAWAVKVSQLPEEWRRWLEDEVYPIITMEQRKAFLALETDAERTAFADRLWTLWGNERDMGGNAFRREYEDRLEYCRNEFGNTVEDRARVLLLNGVPDGRKPIDCDVVFYPLEFWFFGRIERVGDNIVVLFYKPYGLGRFKLWDPTIEGRTVLYNPTGTSALQAWQADPRFQLARPEYRCDPELLRWLDAADYWLRDIATKQAMEHAVPVPGSSGRESPSARFLQFSTVIPKGAKPLGFEVTSSLGSRRGGLVALMLNAKVPRGELGMGKVGEVEVVQLDVTGELTRDGAMVDRFRYTFTFPAAGATEFPVVIEREVRPGAYHLRMKVQDNNSTFAGVQEADLVVPVPAVPTALPVDAKGEEAIKRVASSREAALSLQGPEGEGVYGVQNFAAMVGPKVAKVEFLLDGRLVLTKNKPPFEVQLDLGPLPRLASITAVALDAKGQEIDRRQIDVNVGRERFLVRLKPVGAPDRQGGKVHASVAVNVPTDRKLGRVELYWNELKVATLFAPPFEAWLPVKDDGSIGYMRALAVLEDGAQAEDVQFVNAPQYLTGVQVHTVELPVTVLDSSARPVEGLKEADFDVFEDGVKQSVSFFALQQELPVRLGLVLDTSGSMEKTLPEVQRVVMGFLHNMLRPKDRAYVEAFNERPALIENFTADFGSLERAMIALRADGETALWDASVYGLFQFSGVRGRKAMIILTDGEDNASRMDFDRALDYAQRSGVTIYTIGIDLPITKVGVRSHLSRIARTTGGDAFFLARGASLGPVYERINRELRSQYILAYTSASEAAPDVFRKVAVKVKRPKLEVRTISGYYPGG